MAVSLFSLVPKEKIYDVLNNLQQFTGLAIQLIDNNGTMILSFGQTTSYCAILKKKVFDKSQCFELHLKAWQQKI